jgi:hypothetical protein
MWVRTSQGYRTMKAQALTPKRFEAEEKARQIGDLEHMIREFENMAADLDRQIRAEEDRTRIKDPANLAYSTFAISARLRRNNLRSSTDGLKASSRPSSASERRPLSSSTALTRQPGWKSSATARGSPPPYRSSITSAKIPNGCAVKIRGPAGSLRAGASLEHSLREAAECDWCSGAGVGPQRASPPRRRRAAANRHRRRESSLYS